MGKLHFPAHNQVARTVGVIMHDPSYSVVTCCGQVHNQRALEDRIAQGDPVMAETPVEVTCLRCQHSLGLGDHARGSGSRRRVEAHRAMVMDAVVRALEVLKEPAQTEVVAALAQAEQWRVEFALRTLEEAGRATSKPHPLLPNARYWCGTQKLVLAPLHELPPMVVAEPERLFRDPNQGA